MAQSLFRALIGLGQVPRCCGVRLVANNPFRISRNAAKGSKVKHSPKTSFSYNVKAASCAASGSASSGSSAGLVNNASKVDNGKTRRALRLSKHAAKRKSAELLRGHDDKLASRISACCYVSHGHGVTLERVSHSDGSVSAAIGGVVTCSSVWSCPVCSQRISTRRRDELNELLAWARAKGHAVVMLTLTARHNMRTDLPAFVGDLKEAQKKMRQSRTWRGLSIVGTVNATEVTHGRNGWHPHNHILMVLDASGDDPLAQVEKLRGEWLRQLDRLGRDGNDAAFTVQNATAAGDYVGKFGAGEELALGVNKLGRNGSRSPWQILADARDGCAKSGRLWIAYSLSFKGKRQLHWSNGLKELCGVKDVCDDEIGDDTEPEAVREVLRVWSGGGNLWRHARRRLCALLDAAETGGDLDAAEFGPTDATRWRAELAVSHVIE